MERLTFALVFDISPSAFLFTTNMGSSANSSGITFVLPSIIKMRSRSTSLSCQINTTIVLQIIELLTKLNK